MANLKRKVKNLMINDLMNCYKKYLKKMNIDELANELAPCGDCNNNEGYCDNKTCNKHIADAYFLTVKANIAKEKALRGSIDD